MTTDAPSLPYARDEASTSQNLSAWPAFPPEVYEHEALLDTENDEDDVAEADTVPESNAAPQYWTADRHASRKGKGRSDEDHGKGSCT